MDKNNTQKEFIDALYQGVSAWEKAGKILVKLLSHNPNIKNKILNENPEISSSLLTKLEMVGRGAMRPELLLSDSAAYKAVRALPRSDQDNIVENKRVPLLIETSNGPDIIHADFSTLTSSQVKQVFASDHIRTANEQRLYMESRRKRISKDWEIENGLVVFRRGAKLSVQQLSGIIQEIANSSQSQKIAV